MTPSGTLALPAMLDVVGMQYVVARMKRGLQLPMPTTRYDESTRGGTWCAS